jgi:hypothetical protein
MRIRKQKRILKRMVLGFAVFALVVPSAAMAVPDAGRSYQPVAEDQGSVQLADPKYGQTADENGSIQLRDFPKSLPSVDLGTYGMPSAGLNEYLRTHSGKAYVRPQGESTPQVVDSTGFDWRDAGIGAGILAALIMVAGGAGLASRQLGRPQTA